MVGAWFGWYSTLAVVSWVVVFPSLMFMAEFIAQVYDGSKTVTRRRWCEKRKQTLYKVWNAKLWIRAMRNYDHESQFGWVYIEHLEEHLLRDMPTDAMLDEGRHYMTLSAFKTQYFNCTCNGAGECEECDTILIKISFIFTPLGSPQDPFPPRSPTRRPLLLQ